jgi:hypothetical protein
VLELLMEATRGVSNRTGGDHPCARHLESQTTRVTGSITGPICTGLNRRNKVPCEAGLSRYERVPCGHPVHQHGRCVTGVSQSGQSGSI